jgi:hypothetical protein
MALQQDRGDRRADARAADSAMSSCSDPLLGSVPSFSLHIRDDAAFRCCGGFHVVSDT